MSAKSLHHLAVYNFIDASSNEQEPQLEFIQNINGRINELKLVGQKILEVAGLETDGGRARTLWPGVLPVSPLMKVKTPHESNLKGGRGGERSEGMG